MSFFVGGVTVCGSRHSVNQDAMAFHYLEDGWLLALSDGLGSKKRSQVGSAAVCEAVWTCACQNPLDGIFAEPVEFLRQVHREWLRELAGESVEDCFATVLVLIVTAGKALAIQLGDGFIALRADGETRLLFDDKSEHYINETDCFCGDFCPDPVRHTIFEFETLQGALMCSDGVEIGDASMEDLSAFTADFTGGFPGMSPGEVRYQVKTWLAGWPGTDDKTAVYLLPKGDSL